MTGARFLVVSAWLALATGASQASTVDGVVTVNGAPAGDAVVYLEGVADAPTAAPQRVTMDQKNLMFVPHVLPIVRGTTVEFTNSDDIQHNVFSPSAIAGKFDLGAYGPGAERGVTFDQLGEVVVLCNIHMEMEARILVLRDPYFALTGGAGGYRIADVPVGRYTAKVWQDGFLPTTRMVDVPDTGDLVVDLSFKR